MTNPARHLLRVVGWSPFPLPLPGEARRHDKAVQHAEHLMDLIEQSPRTKEPMMPDARDELAQVIRGGRKADTTQPYDSLPSVQLADAILASDWLAKRDAAKWGEGNDAAIRGFRAPGLDPELNPYLHGADDDDDD